jgi:flagellar motor switch protein FliN/FliY
MVKDNNRMMEVGGILAESAQSVLPMLLPKPVEIAVENIKDWKPQAFPAPMVLITTNFAEGPSGSLYFFVVTLGASMIVDLMLGGDGTAERVMNEEAVDALKEVVNQVLGVTASGLRERFDSKFGFEQVEVHSLEANMDLGLLLDDSDTTMIEFKLALEGLDPLVLSCCFPESTANSLLEAMGGGDQAAAVEAAAPQAEEAPTAQAALAAPELEMELPLEVEGTPLVEQAAAAPKAMAAPNVDLIMDIELPIVIRLGSTEMTLKEIMRMGPDAIIELNKSVDEPVELLVNDQTIAKGEVVVVEGNFAFRVTEITSRSSRIKTLT